MEKRKLGRTGLDIAPLVFGGNVFGWTVDEKTSFRLLDLFLEKGGNCIDTADGYSVWVPGNQGGESETIIGNWLKKTGRRKDIIIATKVGWDIAPGKKGLSKKYILAEVETSLQRLQTDYIDLYQSHKDDPLAPMEETLEAYDQLVKEGKVRYIGASNFTAGRLEESIVISRERGFPSYQVLQPKYNLYSREFETEYTEVVKKYGLGVITYSSLASGFLSGKYQTEKDLSLSARGGRNVNAYLNEKGFAILKVLGLLSEKYHCSPSSLSLAWLLHHPLVTAPIASATSELQLMELIHATEIRISGEDMEMLNNTSGKIEATGSSALKKN